MLNMKSKRPSKSPGLYLEQGSTGFYRVLCVLSSKHVSHELRTLSARWCEARLSALVFFPPFAVINAVHQRVPLPLGVTMFAVFLLLSLRRVAALQKHS